jgi:sulfur relay (sulfurtransferase) DsrF/TusC family protein
MSVGLTLEEGNKVTVIFLGDGVYLLSNINPELIQSGTIYKHLDALRLLGHRVVAEKESLEEKGIEKPAVEAEVVSRSEVIKMIANADSVIPWQ